MRAAVIILMGLVALSLGLTLWHPQQRTVGRALAEALEVERGERLRGAIQIVDYDVGGDAEMGFVRTIPLESGAGDLAGSVFDMRPQRHWMQHIARNSAEVTARFSWESRETDNSFSENLRRAWTPDKSGGRDAVDKALRQMGVAGAVMTGAVSELEKLSDEALVKQWLAADWAMLERCDDRVAAVRQALLLLARPEKLSVLFFAVAPADGEGQAVNVYAIALEDGGNNTWLEMCGYDNEALLWRGVLKVEGGGVPAEVVRRWAARMAEEATRITRRSTSAATQPAFSIPGRWR